MTDQIILKSVGSYIETDGMVGPLMANGLPDISEVGTHINDVSDEWLESLSAEDMCAVKPIAREYEETGTEVAEAREGKHEC